MRRLKMLLILLGVLIAGTIAVIVISRREEKKEEIKNSDAVILSIDPEAVTSLSWEYEETSLSLHRDGEWIYDDDSAFPVSEDVMNSLLSVFENFGAAFEIDSPEDLSQYGLSIPECTIKIGTAEKETTVLLGAFSTMDEKRYVSVGDGKVYLVNHDPMDDYSLELSDLIAHDEIPAAGLSGSEKITFSGTENYTIELKRDSGLSVNEDDIYFTDGQALSTAEVTSLLATVRALDLTNYVSYQAEENLSSYGLDSPELTITLEYPVTDEDDHTEMKAFVLHLSRNPEELAAAEKEAAEQSEKETEDEEGSDPISEVPCYARVGDSEIVYTIPYSSYSVLSAVSRNDLRHKELVTAAWKDISGMDVTLDGETYSLSAKAEIENDEVVRIWSGPDGEEIDSSALQNALTALSAQDADAFTADAPDGKEEIAFTLTIDNDSFPSEEIRLYRHDGESCLAVVDGESLCYVPRSAAVALIEAVNAIVLK